MLSRAPGTEPRTIRRFFSASIRSIRRLLAVRTVFPICPAILRPLMTRDGSVPGPIDPGERRCEEPPWDLRPPPNPCRFTHPLEPTPLGAAADLHPLPDLEHVDRELLSGLVLSALLRLELGEELRDVVETRSGGMTRLRLAHTLLSPAPEAELDRTVAVALRRADLDNGTGTHLEDGDAHSRSSLGEDLGHPELLPDQSAHRVAPSAANGEEKRSRSRLATSRARGVPRYAAGSGEKRNAELGRLIKAIRYWTLISTSTPAARSSFVSASIVWARVS